MDKRFSSVISIMLVFFVTAGTLFYDTYAAEISDEEVALGVYDQDYSDLVERYESRLAMPRLEADSSNFAQALAQDYRRRAGTFELTRESAFYIVSDEEADRAASGKNASGDEASDKKIVYIETNPFVDPERLNETVSLMADLYAEYGIPSGQKLDIRSGPYEKAGENDIVIDPVGLADRDPFVAGIQDCLPDAYIDEAYMIDADGRAEIRACTEDGIYYGLLTLLEIAAGTGDAADHSGEIAAGTGEVANYSEAKNSTVTLDSFRIIDAPDLKERTIFIDCARKYFSKEWLEEFIRRSSLQRYNTIVLHFSEAECMRIESGLFPWLTDGVESLDREEVREIVATAHRYHMDVIPSIDTPGHNRYMVRKYEEYAKSHKDFSYEYGGKTYDRHTKGFTSIANHYERGGKKLKVTDIGIDISKEHARAFSMAMIMDYADFFRSLGCTKFDICGDELMGWSNFMLGENQVSYNNRWLFLEHWQKYARKTLGIRKGSPSDAFITYLNIITGRLEDMGYECRVFNDEIDINKNQHVSLNESTGITYWDPAANSGEHFADTGHTVYNGVMQWTYYVVRKINGKDIMKGRYKTVNAQNIYENWDPRSLSPDAGTKKTIPGDKLGGAYFFIWCDAPDYKSADSIMDETELRTWANSCRMWNPEVNSGESGIRNAMKYEQLRDFALRMRGKRQIDK